MTIVDSPRVARRTRTAVMAVFFLNGLMIASYVVRLPSLKADLHPVGGVAGFAVVGVGTSLLIPIAFSAAGHAGGTGPGAAAFVARFTTFTYAGILLGPAAIGLLAQGIGLQWTIALLIPLLGITALVTRLPAPRDARGAA